ncbi:hypothetical protein HKD37_02G004651 [Glycine soja]
MFSFLLFAHGDRPLMDPSNLTIIPKVSFYDKAAGKPPSTPKARQDLFANNLCIEYEKNNPLLPEIVVDDNYFKNLCEPSTDAFIIKLLGKTIGFPLMMSKLQALWKLQL